MLFETIFFVTIGVLGYTAACFVAGAIFAMILNLILIVLEESLNLVLDVGTLIFRIPMYIRGMSTQEENVSL